MTDQNNPIQQIFERRIALVSNISQLSADQLKLRQKLSGNQFDIMRCRECLEEPATNEQVSQELREAEARENLLNNQMIDCNDKLQTLENELIELDRQLLAL